MPLWILNIFGYLLSNWRKVAIVVVAAVLLIFVILGVRSCFKKTPPKLNEAEIFEAQKAIAENDRKVMEKVLVEKVPVKINNQVIYGNESHFLIPKFETDYSSPVLQSARYLDEYLFVNLKNELSKLEDGRYELRLNNLVIDDKGKIAFFDQAAIEPYLSPDDKELIYRNELRQSLEKRLLDILQGPIQFKPAMKNGKPVNVRFHLEGFLISVKNHEVKLVERPGC